ncbi:zinc-binding alcohol dehydrogenase family protein [Oleiharenicola lentus]|uniref:zinc-binding alcohol dehydrogenase family protein n=1 Tax=Oleiharenicola lentus TaxID=2508720 RepID=UPI003F668C77
MLHITLDEPGKFSAREGPAPTPAPGEALVRVHRIGVCGTDLHAFAGKQPFFNYPRILGHELGVEVVDPGSEPHGLKAGDRCSVEPYMNCGKCISCRRGKPNCCTELRVLGVHTDGGMRPLISVPARKLHKSDTLSYDQLALVETLGIGAHAVERADVQADDFVLVIGAGPIGLSVIQFVQVRGAKLAVMDMSDTRLQFCRKQLGVAHTLAPGAEAAAQLKAIGGGDLPTVVIDATGNPKSMAGTFDLPAHGGKIVFVGLFQGDVTFNDPNFHRRELTLLASRNALPGTFREIISLIEAGRVDTTPWITHRFSLTDTPVRFPEFAGNPAVIKTLIEVAH